MQLLSLTFGNALFGLVRRYLSWHFSSIDRLGYLTRGETGSHGGTHEVVLSKGVIPVTPVSKFSTQDGKVARAMTRHQGEESPHCAGQWANANPLKHTPPGFHDSSSNSEAAIMQACRWMLVLKKQLPLLISRLPLHRNGCCWQKKAVYNHFTISSRFLITSSDHSRPLPRWSPIPNTTARCQEKGCNASLHKAPSPPTALQREEGPTETTHRKLSVPPVTCPLWGGPIYIWETWYQVSHTTLCSLLEAALLWCNRHTCQCNIRSLEL